MSRILALDLDGVIFDFNTRFVEHCNQWYQAKMPMPSNDWPTIWKYPVEEGYMNRAQYRSAWDQLSSTPMAYQFWRFLSPFDGAKDFIHAAQTYYDTIICITSRPNHPDIYRATRDSLEQLGLPNPIIHIASHKVSYIEQHGCTDYIDDKVENIEAAHATDANLFLLDRPWNRTYHSNQVIRITHPLELLEDRDEIV